MRKIKNILEYYRNTEKRLVPESRGVKGLKVLVVFPDEYPLAISNLGFNDVYNAFLKNAFVTVDRAFIANGKPMTYSFDKHIPVSDFDLIAFSISYELQYYSFVQFLVENRIPVFSMQREDYHPFILAGGPAITSNPEPIADALDAAFIGEADLLIDDIVQALSNFESNNERKVALLSIPGIYVPEFRNKPTRQYVFPLKISSESVFINRAGEFGESFLIEIARGCIRKCAFCLARSIYQPCRFFDTEYIKQRLTYASDFIKKVGLISTTVNNHPGFMEILEHIKALGLKASLSSIDARSITEDGLHLLKEVGVQTITLAPETGSERLMKRINKYYPLENFLELVALIARLKFSRLKLYFLAGLPTETEEDQIATGLFIKQIKEIYRGQLSVSVNPFVPKLHTPFYSAPLPDVHQFRQAIANIKRAAGSVRLTSYNPLLSRIQAVIARGGRELLPIFVEAAKGFGLKRAFSMHPITVRYYAQGPDPFALENFE